jgi:hypothetical protein
VKIADTTRLAHLDHDIWWALSGARIAQRRVDAVEAALRRLNESYNRVAADKRQAQREASDLRIHLRDRDAHIRNLEAQLRPHLLAEPEGTQEALA